MKEFRRRDNPDQKVHYYIMCNNDGGMCYLNCFKPSCIRNVLRPNFLYVFMKLGLFVPQYTLAMVGYGDDEMKTTVLELTYNYGVTEYTKGNGYAQVYPC